jgi:hypothetical protein
MIFQENVEIIVMLCEDNHLSEGHTNFIEYWPENVGGTMDIWDSELKLTYTRKEEITGAICKRELQLSCKVFCVC